MYQVQRGILNTIFAGGDCQGPPKFSRIIDGGIGSVTQALSPYFGIAVDESFGSFNRFKPCFSTVVADRGQCMFPQPHYTAVGEMVVGKSFVLFFKRNKWIIPICLLHPLHHIERVIQNLTTCGYKSFIFAFFKIGKIGVLLIKIVVIPDKVNRPE